MIAFPEDIDPTASGEPPLPPPQAWERQPDEPPRAFSYFLCFRDAGPTRSMRKAVAAWRRASGKATGEPEGGEAAGGPRLGVPESWHRYRNAFRWVERCAAYDRHIDEEKQRAVIRAVRLEGQLWTERGAHQRTKAWELSQILMEQARYLAQMPVLKQTQTADGRVTVWEAIDPKCAARGARIGQIAHELATAAVNDAVRACKELSESPDDPEEMRAHIQEATRELVEWQQKMLETASSSLSALDRPPGS